MKVLQINKFLCEHGGAERYLLALTDLLRQQGQTAVLWGQDKTPAAGSAASQFLLPTLDFSRVAWANKPLKIINRLFYSRLAQKRLNSFLATWKPDIVHLHNIYHQISPSILPTLKKRHLPLVMTVHDFKLICPNYSLFTQGQVCERCYRHKYYHCVWRRCLKHSYLASSAVALEVTIHKLFKFYERYIDCFIVPSQFVKNKLQQFGLAAKRLEVLPHFYQPPVLPAVPKGQTILFIGRLAAGKGLELLLSAWQKLKPSDWRLKIAGNGPDTEAVKARAASLNLKNIEFMGWLQPEALQQLIKRCQLVVAPSENYETFGLVILEAYGAKVPVLASSQAAYKELVWPNKTGWLFSPGSVSDLTAKLQQAINNSARLPLMGEQGYQLLVNKFSAANHYQKLIQLYQQIINDNKN